MPIVRTVGHPEGIELPEYMPPSMLSYDNFPLDFLVEDPIQLDATMEQLICEAFSLGASPTIVSGSVGIQSKVLRQWLLDGAANKSSKLRRFFLRVEYSKAMAGQERIGQIASAAQGGTWQAAAWWLERRMPEEFALQRKMEIDHRKTEISINYVNDWRTSGILEDPSAPAELQAAQQKLLDQGRADEAKIIDAAAQEIAENDLFDDDPSDNEVAEATGPRVSEALIPPFAQRFPTQDPRGTRLGPIVFAGPDGEEEKK